MFCAVASVQNLARHGASGTLHLKMTIQTVRQDLEHSWFCHCSAVKHVAALYRFAFLRDNTNKACLLCCPVDPAGGCGPV